MNKTKGFFSFFLAASILLITAVTVDGQDLKKEFSPLISIYERVGAYFEILSEVKIEDRKDAPPTYVTTLTFKNKGAGVIRFGFRDLDTSIYASVVFSTDNKDLSILLKPKETKTMFIKTLKPPRIIPTTELILVWREALGGLEEYSFSSSATIYAPTVYEPDLK